MTETERISWTDARAIFRLVGECLERWHDPKAWREHLLEETRALLDAETVVWKEMTQSALPKRPDLRVIASAGSHTDIAARRMHAYDALDVADRPEMAGLDDITRRFLPEQKAVVRRMEYGDLLQCGFHEEVLRPTGFDDFVASFRPARDPATMSVLLAGRPEGDAPFGDREAALLAAICDAVYPLIGTHLATEEDRSAHGLAPRLRETLDHVLLGLSEKQIAAEMELSRHTVHEYIMQLYRHFEVSGRAELLAYFVHRRPTSRGEVPSHRPVTSNRN